MVLFAGVCFLLAFVVRMRPVARRKAKVLYIRIDNADGGRANIKVASNAEAGRPIFASHTKKGQKVRKQSIGTRRAYQMAGRRLVCHCEIPSRERGLQRRGIAR